MLRGWKSDKLVGGVTNLLMRILDPAFGHPRGVAGRLGGVLTARSNAEQERWVVEHAELHADVLDVDATQLVDDAPSAGFIEVKLSLHARRFRQPGRRTTRPLARTLTAQANVPYRKPFGSRRRDRAPAGRYGGGGGSGQSRQAGTTGTSSVLRLSRQAYADLVLPTQSDQSAVSRTLIN
jgi:hypothetical protein